MEPEARQIPGARGTCALLIEEPDGQPAAARAEILSALARRAVPVQSCADRFEAIAQAVLAEESRRTPGVTPAVPVLILTASQAGRFGSTVHDALVRTAPHSAVWVHDPSRSPPLAAFRGAERPAEARGEPVVVADAARQMRPNPRAGRPGATAAGGGPQLRLSGDGPPVVRPPSSGLEESGPSGPVEPGAAPAPSVPLLSDDELAMLLSDEWDRSGPAGPGGGA